MHLQHRSHNPDMASLLIRVGVAAIFIFNGFAKLQNMPGAVEFLSTIGLNAPVVYVITFLELAAGLAMLFGIFTFWAGIVIATMVVVLNLFFAVSPQSGGVGPTLFHDTLILLSALAVSFLGPGKHTVYHWLAKHDPDAS